MVASLFAIEVINCFYGQELAIIYKIINLFSWGFLLCPKYSQNLKIIYQKL